MSEKMSERQVNKGEEFPRPLPLRIERMKKSELIGLLIGIYYNIETRTDGGAVQKIREIIEGP